MTMRPGGGLGAAVLLLTLLASAPASGAWNQPGGDTYKSGTVHLPDGPLDVVAGYEVHAQDHIIPGTGMSVVDTPYGPTLLLLRLTSEEVAQRAIEECVLIRLTDHVAGTMDELARYPCENGGKLLGYDRTRDLLFISVEQAVQDTLLRVVDAEDGSEVWATGPTIDVPMTPAVGDAGDWWVDDLVIDEEAGIIYAPFGSDGGPHSLEAIDVEARRAIWQTTVPAQTVQGLPADPPATPADEATGYPATWTITMTRTDTGLVALLLSEAGFAWQLAWLDEDGKMVDRWQGPNPDLSAGDAGRAPNGHPRTWWPAAQGPRAVAMLDDALVYVDPALHDADVVTLPDRGLFPGNGHPPVWLGDHVFASTRRGAYVHQPNTGDLERWPGYQGGLVEHVVGTDDGAALVLIDQGTRTTLARVDLDDARTVHALPLPDVGFAPSMTPVTEPSGLLVWDNTGGRVVLVGQADPALIPTATIDTRYPAVDEPVALTMAADGADRFVVGWGDGSIDTVRPGETARRAFADEGLHTVRVTAIYPDNRTGTATLPVYAGATPPQDLNALQTAFAPENQDMTFGVLGIAVALGGGLIAVGRRRSRRGRLQEELDAIQAAYEQHQHDAARCEAALSQRRAHIGGLLLDGKLDESQVALLERRIDDLGQQLRLSVLDDRFQFLPYGMVMALRDMLGDGRISAWEREHVLQAIEEDEVLTPEQKGKVRALVDGWYERDGGARA